MLMSLNNGCNIPAEKLPFELFGLCLQEPMAWVTNWIVAATAFILYFRFKPVENDFQKHWKLFYLYFGLSTFFSAFGHVFFMYFGVFGKYPTWILGMIGAYHAGTAMISLNILKGRLRQTLKFILSAKLIVLMVLALALQNFVFVMADATLTYLVFCLGLGIYYWRKGVKSFKFTVIAVLILFPSIFIFTLQFNPHIWFNKDDLSHVLMAMTIVFFYLGVSRLNEIELERIVSLNKLKYVSKQ
ncbi:MAG: DUF6962 family protein [Bacteroidota bacterium]